MSDLIESIKRGLEEAVSHQQGAKAGVRLFTPEEVDVKKVQKKSGAIERDGA